MAQLNAIGIDFGTSSTRIGVFRNGNFELILSDQGHRKFSSTVAFTDTECLIGHAAQIQAIINPKNTVFNIKRLMGRTFDDPFIQANVKNWPFTVKNVENEPKVEVFYEKTAKLYHPEEISSMILAKAKETAEVYLGKEVTGAVITVPANFNNSQRQATLDAGTLAGFNELRLINEPTAAAIAYGVKRHATVKQNILVLHLGGGSFDVTVLTIDEKDVIEVKSTVGHTHLGGEEFSNSLAKNLAEFANLQFEEDFGGDENAVRRLQNECENAKIALTSSIISRIKIGSSSKNDEEDTIHLEASMSRARFEKLNADYFQEIADNIEGALIGAEMETSNIYNIILVGGSTHMPRIHSLLQDIFDGKPSNTFIDSDEAVVYGAAVEADILQGEKFDKTPKMICLDVNSQSLGFEIFNGLMNIIIEKNRILPIEETFDFNVRFSKFELASFKIIFYEGEHRLVQNNKLLGEFESSKINSKSNYIGHIEIKLVVNENGILEVSAFNLWSGESIGLYPKKKLLKCQICDEISFDQEHKQKHHSINF